MNVSPLPFPPLDFIVTCHEISNKVLVESDEIRVSFHSVWF